MPPDARLPLSGITAIPTDGVTAREGPEASWARRDAVYGTQSRISTVSRLSKAVALTMDGGLHQMNERRP